MSLIIVHVGSATGQMFAENWIIALVTAVLLILIVVVMFKIDWEKTIEKYLPQKKGKSRQSSRL